MKLSDYVMQFIARQGIEHIFYLPGGGAMHLVDSLGKLKDVESVCCLHEQAVAIAAQSYAMHTNHLGVGLVTTGPGGTNAITGVCAAWIDSVPCLFVSGQVKLVRDIRLVELALGDGVKQVYESEKPIIVKLRRKGQ